VHHYMTCQRAETHRQERIQLRIVPNKESGLSEVRFWREDKFLGVQKVRNSELNLVQL